MRYRWLSISLVLVVLLGAVTLFAQQPQPESRKEPVFKVNPFQEEEFRNRLLTAQALIRQHDYLSAADLLEQLYDDNPDREVVANQLRQCYDRLKAYDKLARLTERQLKRNPEAFALHIEMARVKVMQSKEKQARDWYRRALALATKDQDFQDVLGGLALAGYEEEAEEIIDSLLPLTERPLPLLLQRGIILQQQKKYGRAAIEYLSILEDTSRLARDAEQRLLDLLEFESSTDEVKQALLGQADSLSSVRGLRLLADHYLADGQFEAAFRLTVRQDSIENGQGRALVRMLVTCRDRHLYKQAIEVAHYIIENYTKSPSLTQTHFVLAEVFARSYMTDSALAVYHRLIEMAPHDRDKAEALFFTGMLYLDQRDDPMAALGYFDSVVSAYPRGTGYLRALTRRPHCYLRLGDLAIADSLFAVLMTSRLTEAFAEEAEYYRGLIRFCQGELDSARLAFQKLMVSYPRGIYVNDALRLQLAMDRAQNSPELMATYGQAVLYQARQMTDSTLAALERVALFDDQTLADLALYRSLEIYLQRSDTTAAMEQAERLVADFPESYYTPYGLKVKADILYDQPDEHEAALQIYRQLLTDHPNYPFAADIRERLKAVASGA